MMDRGHKTQYYTTEALANLDTQIDDARIRLTEALGEMGAGAEADSNTWHDNPAFEEADSKVNQYTRLLAQLQGIRAVAEVVEVSADGIVDVGSTVKIQYDDGEIEKVMITGAFVVSREIDADIMSISSSSPLGASLMKKMAQDTFSYQTPRGKVITGVVVEVG